MTGTINGYLRKATWGAALLAAFAGAGLADKMHGIAMYGEPALPPDFVALPYANPDAPQGGRIIFGEAGSFDSMRPHIVKGSAPYAVGAFVFDTLMARSYDEPFSLYGLLAESIEVGPNREWVEFTLNPAAKFSDGSPVTPEDVLWSFQTLGELGHPRYHAAWDKIATSEITGDRSVKFTFNTPDRELPLILGLRPILKKAQWEGVDFEASGFDIVPIGAGPYMIGEFEEGKFITLKKNPDYWGKDLAINAGKWNFDEIRYDYYGDGDVLFEAFKAGEFMSYRETNASKWATSFAFPRVTNGDVVLSTIPHQRPSGIMGFVMNTRRDVFKDWRVREALITAFNFEFINTTITGGVQPRISSYFSNSFLAYQPGPAPAEEAALLAPYADELLPGTLEGYALPVGDGTERNRDAITRATALMEEAGWTVQDGVMKNAAGEAFTFEILLVSNATENQQTIDLYVAALERLGIRPNVSLVDSAQYQDRTKTYDFDMAYHRINLSLSPGNEQTLYWGSAGVTEPGTRNWAGVNSKAVDGLVAKLLTAETQEDATTTVRALDRVLTAGRYFIPIWFSRESYLAYSKSLHFPETLPLYGDFIGFQPDVWWYQE
jgi:peptide/nickel transport system substrate-binding protein